MNKGELTIHLIKEELRNKKLMHSLEELGFDCSLYTLDISRVVLELAGFEERTDRLYQWYFGLIDNALDEMTFRNLYEMLDKWSVRIHMELQKKRSGMSPLF
ncbi:MAG: hypothetical protein PVF73_08555 [Bacteroidales bacterium]|jgi:hypothetical protein